MIVNIFSNRCSQILTPQIVDVEYKEKYNILFRAHDLNYHSMIDCPVYTLRGAENVPGDKGIITHTGYTWIAKDGHEPFANRRNQAVGIGW